MPNEKIGVCITTFNNQDIITKNIEAVLGQETELDLSVYVVDDGSTDETPARLTELAKVHKNLHIDLAPHRERGVTRTAAIAMAIDSHCEYMMFIDSDMILRKGVLQSCFQLLKSEDLSAVIVPEVPFSDHDNFMTQVKIFEREIINDAGEAVASNSIEAARFWTTSEYLRSGGLNPGQIAFEETQPTIRIIERGGKVLRLGEPGLMHDEGKVTLANLMQKKSYYFGQMSKTTESESRGLFKAISRWYFFRSYLYSPRNLRKYVLHPFLFFGLIFMYISLTFSAVYAHLSKR